MITVGLDFSFSSAAFCLKKDGNYKWVVIMKDESGKKSFNYKIRKELENTEVEIYVIPNSGHRGNQEKDQEWIEDRIKWSNKIISILENNIHQFNDCETEYKLNIEDTSYSKQTNNVIDLTSAITLFKNELLKSNYCLGWNMYSPSKVKNKLGAKGNASKLDVLKSFQDNLNKSPIEKSDFWKYVKNLIISKDISHYKPIDDCIDAYGLVEFE